MKTMSLRARIIAAMVFVGVALIAAGFIVTTTTHGYLVHQVDARLDGADRSGRGQNVRDLGVRGPRDDPDGQGRPGRRDSIERLGDVYEGVITADGVLQPVFVPNLGGQLTVPQFDVVALQRAAASDRIVTLTSSAGDGVANDDTRYRVRAISGRDDVVYVTALSLDDVDRTLRRLIAMEIIATSIIMLALALVTWWVLRLGIRPVREMTHAAGRIAAGDLSERVPETSPSTEAGELSIALNQMLGRIETAFAASEQSQERLRRFVADASHELRTPVTTIRGYAELYRVGGLSEHDQLADAMARTEQEAQRMSRLIDDLLALAAFDQQRPLAMTSVDITRVVRDSASDAAVVQPTRTISVHGASSAMVTGNEDRLRQVLANVIGNALVHTPVVAALDITITETASDVVVAVRDHGPGMTSDVSHRITERFFRADASRSRAKGGSGLGLSIVDAAVAAHGGQLDVDSTPGVGTTVTITLPRSNVNAIPSDSINTDSMHG
jgi:two-component system, OmpR family, sensor kinase